MTEKEREMLFMRWDLYDPPKKNRFMAEYLLEGDKYNQASWLNHLRSKLDIDDCKSAADQA